MKNINVLFQKNPDLKNITVTISASETDEQIEYLMDLVRNSGGNDIYVQDDQGRQKRITEDRIIRILADRKYVSVYADDGVYSLRKTLQETENMLHGRMFLKISRFEIINLQKVRNFDFTIAGTLRIEFENGSTAWASRRYIPLIRQKLSERKNI